MTIPTHEAIVNTLSRYGPLDAIQLAVILNKDVDHVQPSLDMLVKKGFIEIRENRVNSPDGLVVYGRLTFKSFGEVWKELFSIKRY